MGGAGAGGMEGVGCSEDIQIGWGGAGSPAGGGTGDHGIDCIQKYKGKVINPPPSPFMVISPSY